MLARAENKEMKYQPHADFKMKNKMSRKSLQGFGLNRKIYYRTFSTFF